MLLTQSGLFYDKFSIKNYTSQSPRYFWLFLNMYVCTLTSIYKKCHMCLDRLGKGDFKSFKSASQDMLCIFWTYLHFHEVLFVFYHVRCLNIPKFSHWFIFGVKELKHVDCCVREAAIFFFLRARPLRPLAPHRPPRLSGHRNFFPYIKKVVFP